MTNQTTEQTQISYVWVALFATLMAVLPDLAYAQAGPGTNFLQQAWNWMQQWGLYLCYIGFAIIGILFWFNVIDLRRLGWACVGVVVFFGTPQIVTWIRGGIS